VVFSSTVFSAFVLSMLVVLAIGASYAAQLMRVGVANQVEARVLASLEAVAAEAYGSGRYVVVVFKNLAARPVEVREARVVATYSYAVADRWYTEVVARSWTGFRLQPGGRALAVVDFFSTSALPQGAYGLHPTHIAVSVATERNSFTYDPAPSPTDTLVLVLTREDIGRGVSLTLPGGARAQLTPYEFLACGVSRDRGVKTLEAVRVLVASSPTADASRPSADYTFNYGVDPSNGRGARANIDVHAYRDIFRDTGYSVDVVRCRVQALGMSLQGATVFVARGLVLLSSGLSGLDVVAFASGDWAEPLNPGNLVGGGPPTRASPLGSSAFISKVAVPDARAVNPLRFVLASMAVPPAQRYMDLGNYYSEGIVVGFSAYFSAGSGGFETVYVGYGEPYPVLLVITAPSPVILGR